MILILLHGKQSERIFPDDKFMIYCDFCRSPVPFDEKPVQYPDGTILCESCQLRSIIKIKQFEEIFNSVTEWFKKELKVEIEKERVEREFLNRSEMFEIEGKIFKPTPGYDPPRSLGFYMRWIVSILCSPNLLMRLLKRSFFIVIPLVVVLLIWLTNENLTLHRAMSLWGIIFFVILIIYVLISQIFPSLTKHQVIVHSGYDRDFSEQIMAHEIAHYVHHRSAFIAFFNKLLDLILYPLFTSYSEGMATWVESIYAFKKGKKFDPDSLPIHYRNGYRLITTLERILGIDLIFFLLDQKYRKDIVL
jgi:hypothetical protein